MKRKLVFIIPGILLLAFLAFKPPAIGSEKGNVIVTPEATITPSTKPQLRDFDDEVLSQNILMTIENMKNKNIVMMLMKIMVVDKTMMN